MSIKQTADTSTTPDSLHLSWPAHRDLVVVLGRLARLRDADVLTEEEFQRERVKIVDGWTSPTGWRPDNGRDQISPSAPPATSRPVPDSLVS